MNRNIFAIITLCLLCSCTKAQIIEPKVNENVELMSILSRLAGFPEYNMNLGGQYILDINAYFGKYTNHPAVLQMKELRKNNGISYDAVMSMAVHLNTENSQFTLYPEEESTLEQRWNNVDKENFLTLLSQFYRDSDFHRFFTEHQKLYQKGIQTYKDKVMKKFDQNWYSEFYGKVPEENFSVIIGFGNDGGNYGTNRHLKEQKKEIFAIVGYHVDKAGVPQYNEAYLPTLIHEFNHSFINYLLDDALYPQHVQQLEKSGKVLLQSSLWAMSKQAYNNWKTVINESLVRAAVICYMLDKKYSEESIREDLTGQLQRNFRWMPELVQLLRKYQTNRAEYPSLETFYPEIIHFFDEYTETQENKIKSVIRF